MKKRKKKEKRGQGEGTVRQRKDGMWEARYTVGVDVDGKQRRKSVYGKSEEEVKDKLKKVQNQVYNGTFILNDSIRLGEWIREWLELYKKNTVRPTTYECLMMYSKHIYKADISCLKIVELKPFHFQKFYNDKMKTLKPASIRKLHNILKSAMTQAVKNELINTNPVMRTEPPAMDKSNIEIMTIEEQEVFIKALEGENLKPLFLLAMQTGMRIGEILALKWCDVDLKNNTITVKGTARRVITNFEKESSEIKSKIAIQDPKTKNSIRTIPLMPAAVQNLKLLKHRENIKNINDGKTFDRNKIVFTTSKGTYNESKNVNRILYRILKNNGLKRLSFHSLRHTFVSRMLESGEDIKTISEIIGHSKTSFTLDTYAHILPSKKHSAVERLNHFFAQK